MLSSFVKINQTLVDQLARVSLITANERLAREYQRSIALYQQTNGPSAWPTPDILSLGNFLSREYTRLREQYPGELKPLASTDDLVRLATSTRPDAPAHVITNFLKALTTVIDYDIDPRQIERLHHACEYFVDWAYLVQADLARHFQHPASIAEVLLSYNTTPERPLAVVLLEQMTLPESRYFENLLSNHEIMRIANDATTTPVTDLQHLFDEPGDQDLNNAQLYSAEAVVTEIQAAASWAADIAANQPDARVGIVVPDLTTRRAQVTHQLGLAFNSASGSSDARFDISGAEPMNKQAIWQSAKQMLNLTLGPATPEMLKDVSNSVFFKDLGLNELLANWPRILPRQTNLRALIRHTESKALQEIARLVQPSDCTLGQWVIYFESVLTLAGWPNLSNLGSRQYQAYQNLSLALSKMEDSRHLDAGDALAMMDLLLSQHTFAPERTPANVLVLGLLEANGLQFDALWVCGMDEENFPGRNINIPFIPRSIAITRGVPRADQSDELQFSSRLLARWSRNVDDMAFSFTRTSDDFERGPSPLLRGLEVTPVPPQEHHPWHPGQRAELETYTDDYGLPHPPDTLTRGGVGLLDDQANCPFKAYANYRLKLNRAPEPVDLPDALARGIVLHDALFALFEANTDQNGIAEFDRDRVFLAAEQALIRLRMQLPALFAHYERARIAQLIFAWLEVEQAREPFSIDALERSFEITLGALQLTVRVDRLDRIKASGQLVVIDYKSGRVTTKDMIEPPLTQLQLPIYSLVDEEIYGAFYASIRQNRIAFTGVCSPEADPGSARCVVMPRPWAEQISLWRAELTGIANDFMQGYAAVKPAKGACEYCNLQRVCRVFDHEPV